VRRTPDAGKGDNDFGGLPTGRPTSAFHIADTSDGRFSPKPSFASLVVKDFVMTQVSIHPTPLRYVLASAGIVAMFTAMPWAALGDEVKQDQEMKAVREFLSSKYPGKSWQIGPARIVSSAVEAAYPGLKFYYVYTDLETSLKNNGMISLRMRRDKEGKIAPVQFSRDFNQGLMAIGRIEDAIIAAAAVMSIQGGPVSIAASDVQVTRKGGEWDCKATKQRSQFHVVFDRDGKCAQWGYFVDLGETPAPPSPQPRKPAPPAKAEEEIEEPMKAALAQPASKKPEAGRQRRPDEASELRALGSRAYQMLQNKEFLRAHVALRRIDERFHGTPAYAKWEKELQRLAKNVAAHIDLEAVEDHDDYVLYNAPSTAKPWPALVRSFEQKLRGTPSTLLLRVFLEDPSRPDVIQVKGEGSCNMLDVATASGCAYVQIADGGLAAVWRGGGERCTFRIGALQHGSPTIEASIPFRRTTVLGDVVLLRPAPERTGQLHIAWDIRRKKVANSPASVDSDFLLGRITAGGLYGLSVKLRPGAGFDAGQLLSGPIWIVWAANPRRRWQIDVPAGQKTEARFRLDRSGEIADPQISRTAAVGPPSGNGKNTAPNDDDSPSDRNPFEERE
jgi:hypothetical protein